MRLHAGGSGREGLILVFAAAALAAAARAIILALLDCYATIGLAGLAARTASRDCLVALAPCAAVALAIHLTTRWRGGTLARLVGAGVAAVLAWAFVSGRLTRADPFPDRLYGRTALVVRVWPYVSAIAVGALLGFGDRLAPLLRRVIAGGAVAGTAAAAVALFLPAKSTAQVATRERPNVVLISLDTVRADRVGCYGYPHPTTPEIDRFFARDSARFTAAFAPQPWTLTSHMTMLTSLHPVAHGVTAERPLPIGVHTLAESFSNHGYLAFGQAYDLPWMARRYGFGRGFHSYRNIFASISARQVTVDALLDDLAGERFFLFLHYYDAHSDWGGLPYESALRDRKRFTSWYHGDFTGADATGRKGTDVLLLMNNEKRTFPEETARYVTSLYDAGLATLDRGLGVLFRSLESRGLLSNTIVVVTSDHGEEFQEHGKLLHTQAYDECLHVPLLFRIPGLGEPRVCTELVGLEDLAPTLLEWCGLPIPETMQGQSLRASILGESSSTERSHLLLLDQVGAEALRTNSWKLISRGESLELYDLATDSSEHVDRRRDASAAPAAEGLQRLLESEQRRVFALRSRFGTKDAAGVVLTESELKQLRALGYLSD